MMKKILIVITLSLLSLAAFSEENKQALGVSEVKQGTVRKLCGELNRDIFDTKNDIVRTRHDMVTEKNKQAMKDYLPTLNTLQDIQKENLDTWQKLGCVEILYK